MSELRTIEREVEEKVHTILHELEAQLKGIFGTQPQISHSVAEAKKKVSAITTPITESVDQNPTISEPSLPAAGSAKEEDVQAASQSQDASSEDHPTTET